ncbi:hypothetical protein CONLIGDRAFT_16503 [Coniochaeta ligniaria NRRL 30616]|uniref:Secreted protein n=1 Tax=Coniochaeta ligniaria NRRL 30616 TaxID=1408157 RepID=A0A1J7J5H0_9PEZI|nr:hypothetical protein CONLIGDRAFT_16503 [Coniochaeta ligniaria NRRL 30616]
MSELVILFLPMICVTVPSCNSASVHKQVSRARLCTTCRDLKFAHFYYLRRPLQGINMTIRSKHLIGFAISLAIS